jgi:phosphatidate cytidylyltransferase
MARSELAARVAVAVVGIPFALVVIYLGGWVLGVVLAVFAGIAAYEYQELSAATGGSPFSHLGVAASVLLVLAAAQTPSFQGLAVRGFALVLILTLAGLALSVWRRWPGGRPITAVSATVVAAIYTGGSLAFALLLRHLPPPSGGEPMPLAGAALLFFPILVTWVGDSAAYFAGRAWGKRKLIPQVSPGKTVVGGVAGLVGSVVIAALYAGLVLPAAPRPGLNPVTAALMGLALGAAAQVGDLAASVMKREAGVKDSGRLLPGHGGALDRFDALFLNIPLAYALIRVAEVLA